MVKKLKLSSLTMKLLEWYFQNPREMPWRGSRDPYLIWISEVMLQQTTVQAVRPYFDRFVKKFPDLESLATSSIEDVYEVWSGLGYYSRARNLHKSAVELNRLAHFPETFQQLLPLPGFGPYTARAVASIAFDQNVGVVDGNVIRVLSRWKGAVVPAWTTRGRDYFQDFADQLVKGFSARDLNQALMDLGSTICTPKRPACLVCPWNSNCYALQTKSMDDFPIKKAKSPVEIWHWQAELKWKNKTLAFTENKQAPFLKNQWILPGEFKKLKAQPKKFNFVHSITKYKIFVTFGNSLAKIQSSRKNKKDWVWLPASEWKKRSPTNLVQKILKTIPTVAPLVLAFLINACHSAPTVPLARVVGLREDPQFGTQVTWVGQNEYPIRLEGSDLIYFLSRGRSLHNNSQIYSFDLKTQKEKRLQFSDGETIQVLPVQEKTFLFVSTTDEDKESPRSLYPRNPEGGPEDKRLFTEVYLTQAKNIPPQRMTFHQGFDGQLWADSKSREEVYFLQQKTDNVAQVQKLSWKNQKTSIVENSLPYPVLGFWVFKNQTSALIVHDGQTELMAKVTGGSRGPQGLQQDWASLNKWNFVVRSFFVLSTQNRQLIFETADKTNRQAQIIFWDGEKNCQKILLSSKEGQFSHPSYDENSQKLLFSFQKDSQTHIYLKNLVLNGCL